MAFYIVALEPAQFDAWLATQRQPAVRLSPAQQRGENLFLSSGCGGCHAIRGTKAAGKIAPDLTHVGGRLTIGAATLPANAGSIARWIRDNQHIKPNNRMPAFGILSGDDLAALGAYLESSGMSDFPNALPRPKGELAKLAAAWKVPRGLALLTAVNNTTSACFYIAAALLFFILAGILALMMRLQLAVPGKTFPDRSAKRTTSSSPCTAR